MSDPKSWIEERLAIHAAAELKAKVESDRGTIYTAWTGAHDSGGLPEDDREHIADSYAEGAEAITDALNMFPRALDALNKVLELHKPVASLGFSRICMVCMELDNPEESDSASFVEYPCPTVRAIEGAIND